MRVVLMACVALLFLYGCNTQKRDIKRLDTYFVQYGAESARLSNLIYPCFTGKAKSDTIIKTKIDTVIGFSGSIHVDSVSHDTVYRTRIKVQTITKTVINDIHDTVQNMRLVTGLNLQIKDLRDSMVTYRTKLTDAKNGKNTWMWIAIGGIGLIVVTIVVKVVKLFYGGAISKVI